MKWALCAVMALAIGGASHAATWHIAAGGSDGNGGTSASDAWTIYQLENDPAGLSAAGGDTILVHAGTYSAAESPGGSSADVDIHAGWSGTETDRTWLIAVEGEVIWDGASGTTQAFEWHANAAEWIAFEGPFVFSDYGVITASTGGLWRARPSTGSARGLYVNGAIFRPGSGETEIGTCFNIDDTNSADEKCGQITISNCLFSEPGDASIIVADYADTLKIHGNRFIRSSALGAPSSASRAMNVNNSEAVSVSENYCDGTYYCFDTSSGACPDLKVDRNISWRTYHHAFGSRINCDRTRFSRNFIKDTGITDGGYGIYVEADACSLISNTIFNTGNPPIWLKDETDHVTNVVVLDNVIVVDDDGTVVTSQTTGDTLTVARWDHNVYYYTGGNVDFNAAGFIQGSALTFAQWQALGYDANGAANTWPALADTANNNFHPTASSNLLHAGYLGRTIGALPCRPCWWWLINGTSAADSLALEVTSPSGTRTRVKDGGLWDNGDHYLYDQDMSGESGQWAARWSVYDAGDSTEYRDEHVEWNPMQIASAVEDTLAAELTALQTTADTIDGNTTSIGADLESDLSVDLSAVAAGVSALPNAAAIADAVLDEEMTGHDGVNTVGEHIGYNSPIYSNTANIGLDLESDLGVDLSAMAAAITAMPTSVETQLSDDFAGIAGAAVATGSYAQHIRYTDSVSGNPVVGAHSRLYSDAARSVQIDNQLANSNGVVSFGRDPAAVVYGSAWLPGIYELGTFNFTVATDQETTSVMLDEITVPAPTTATSAVVSFAVYNASNEPLEDIQVCWTLDEFTAGTSSLTMLSGLAAADCDTTDASGLASAEIAWTSESGSTVTFTFTDVSGTRLGAHRYRTTSLFNLTIPDEASFNVQTIVN